MNNIIDVHTHFLPKSYVDALKKNVVGDPDGWPTPSWNEQTTLGFMKKNKIGYSLLSLSSPHINFGDKEETVYLAQNTNDYGRKLSQQYSSQLGYLASLPLPYENESVDEINRSLSNGAKGFAVPSNSRGIYFGTPLFEKVYERLNQEHAVVLMHPNQTPVKPMNVNVGMPTPLMGFLMDTTMTFMNLLQHHFFDKYPDIRLIIPHGGAFMPILADRDAPYTKETYKSDMFAAMEHVYFDTAGAVFPRQLPMLLTLADPTHILYGSDIPYTNLSLATQLLDMFTEAGGVKAKFKFQAVNTASKLGHFIDKKPKLAKYKTLIDESQNMLTGADILTPRLRDMILHDNAVKLFDL